MEKPPTFVNPADKAPFVPLPADVASVDRFPIIPRLVDNSPAIVFRADELVVVIFAHDAWFVIVRLFVPVIDACTVRGPAKRLLPVVDVVLRIVNDAVEAEVKGAVVKSETGPVNVLVVVVDVKLQLAA